MDELDHKLKRHLVESHALELTELLVAENVAILRAESLGQVLLKMELIDPAVLHSHIVDAIGFPIVRLQDQVFRICFADRAAIERSLDQVFRAVSSSGVAESESDAVSLLDELLATAIEQSVSDVHIEPSADYARVRFRCDGVLHCWRHIRLAQWQPLVGRIKVLASLDIADSRSPQDGRFSQSSHGREVDVRVSVMPTDRGEAIVMRLLDAGLWAYG